MHTDVGIASHASLFHLGVAGVDGHEDGPEFGHVLSCLVSGADVGAADDLDQRHAGAVEVDEREVAAVDASAGTAEVGALAGVFFEVRALDADLLAARKLEETIDVDRLVVLTDLICLGHVGVEVVLAMKRARLDGAVQCQPYTHGQFNRLAVEHR